ncbi:MAG: TM2 domain-containing protein [Clostridia bacterium]|nr:TM2 domain-containing protein [Clostridia bacterium]
MKCSSCGAQLQEGASFCSYCGTGVDEGTARGENTSVQHIHVHNHYYEQQPEDARVVETVYVREEARSPKSRVILLVLYFVLGYVGAHKFYSGRIGMGVLYAVTGGIFGIGLFVDFFSILFGTPRDSRGLPIRW